VCDCDSELTLERMNLEKQLADMQKKLREADEQRRLGFWPSSAHASLFSSYANPIGSSSSTSTGTGMVSPLMYGQLSFNTGESPYLFSSSTPSVTTTVSPGDITVSDNKAEADEGGDDDDDDDDDNEEEHALMSEQLLRTLLLSHPVNDGDDNDADSHSGTT